MNKNFKTILLSSLLIFGLGFLAVLPAKAVVPELTVEWSETGDSWLPLSGPIFNEANFLPGAGVIRLIRVTNNSDSSQRIGIEAINQNNPDDFASQLNLVVEEGATIIFNDTLAKFFSQGDTFLSDLASGAATQYDLTIAFNSASDNTYQEKAVGFDILVGFQGTEGGLPLPEPGGGTGGGGGGGGGGGLPPGLIIINESATVTADTSVTIYWLTNYPATTQVIYAEESEAHTLDLTDNGGVPPKYGYAHTTTEFDKPANPNGVFSHSVTIFGLTPDTKYYYRAISHGSLAISEEHSFVTILSLGGGTISTGGGNTGEGSESGGRNVSENVYYSNKNQGNTTGSLPEIIPGGMSEEIELGIIGGNNIQNQISTFVSPTSTFGRLLAAIIGAGVFNWRWILILLGLIMVILIIWWLFRKAKKKTDE